MAKLWKRLDSEQLRGKLTLTVTVVGVLIACLAMFGVWWNATKSSAADTTTISTSGDCSGVFTGNVNAGINQNCK